jgi:hypothetical protein
MSLRSVTTHERMQVNKTLDFNAIGGGRYPVQKSNLAIRTTGFPSCHM